MAAAVDPQVQMDQVLTLIGIQNSDHRVRIIDKSFLNGLSDFRSLSGQDIDDMAKDYSTRSTNNQRIMLGLARVRRLKGVMHVVQDCLWTD